MGKKDAQVNKVRKVTFLHGQADKVISNLKSSDGKNMIDFFTNLIVNHPEYACNSKRGKKKEKQKEKVTPIGDGVDDDKQSIDQLSSLNSKPKNPLRDEIIFGLTEIIKKVQNGQLIGVVVNDPLTIHLQATLFDLCKEFNVPFLLSKNLNQIGDILKMSKLSCYAFSEKVKESTSLCHPLYEIFLKQPGLSFSERGKINPCLLPKDPNKEIVENSKPEFVFDFPPEEYFHIPREEVSDPSIDTNKNENKMDDFIKIDHQVNHFPPRLFFREIKLTLPWIGDDDNTKKTQKIGKSLFTVKSSLEKTEYHLDDEIPFSEPQTVQLPSSGRVREKRKKFKKIKQKPIKQK